MPEVTDQYIRVPVTLRRANDIIRTIAISAGEGISALYSVNRKTILTYLFKRSKGWDMAKAKIWIEAHK
jgi:hypothetical protein